MWGRGRSEKAVSKDKCPQGRIYSKPRPGREDKGGGTGKDREGKKAPQHRRTAKVVGHGRVRVPKARIPAAQAGPGIALQAHRGVPILGNHADCGGRAVERWRGAGGGRVSYPLSGDHSSFLSPLFWHSFPPTMAAIGAVCPHPPAGGIRLPPSDTTVCVFDTLGEDYGIQAPGRGRGGAGSKVMPTCHARAVSQLQDPVSGVPRPRAHRWSMTSLLFPGYRGHFRRSNTHTCGETEGP